MNSATTLKLNTAILLGYGLFMAINPGLLVDQFQATKVNFDNYEIHNTFLNWGITNLIAAGLIMIVSRVKSASTTSAAHFGLTVINLVTTFRNILSMESNISVLGADKSRMYLNTALFAFLAYSHFKNWQASGSKIPKFFNLVDGQNDLSTNGLRLFAFAHAFFGFMLIFKQKEILAQFGMPAAAADHSIFLTQLGFQLVYTTFLLICVHSTMDGDVHYALNRLAWCFSAVWAFTACSTTNTYRAQGKANDYMIYNSIFFIFISFVNGFAVTTADTEDHK